MGLKVSLVSLGIGLVPLVPVAAQPNPPAPPSRAADLRPAAAESPVEILDFNGWWRTNIASTGDPVYIRFEIQQQGREVDVIHREGLGTVPRGARIFHGTYQDLEIIGQSRSAGGTWVANAMRVDDPDHLGLDGRLYERTTRPPPDNPRCEPTNRFKVKANYATSRAYRLVDAKQYDQSNCWYTIATDLGDSVGVQGLAYAYGKGLGVAKDPQKSFRLDSIAAEQNNPFAQVDLAFDYATGFGVTKDPDKAAYWKRRHDQLARAQKASKRAPHEEVEEAAAPLGFLPNLARQVIGTPP